MHAPCRFWRNQQRPDHGAALNLVEPPFELHGLWIRRTRYEQFGARPNRLSLYESRIHIDDQHLPHVRTCIPQ